MKDSTNMGGRSETHVFASEEGGGFCYYISVVNYDSEGKETHRTEPKIIPSVQIYEGVVI